MVILYSELDGEGEIVEPVWERSSEFEEIYYLGDQECQTPSEGGRMIDDIRQIEVCYSSNIYVGGFRSCVGSFMDQLREEGFENVYKEPDLTF